MLLYTVIAFWWDSWEFVGVYRTREAAEAAGTESVGCSGWSYEIHEAELGE